MCCFVVAVGKLKINLGYFWVTGLSPVGHVGQHLWSAFNPGVCLCVWYWCDNKYYAMPSIQYTSLSTNRIMYCTANSSGEVKVWYIKDFSSEKFSEYHRAPFVEGYKFCEKGKSTFLWKLFSRINILSADCHL